MHSGKPTDGARTGEGAATRRARAHFWPCRYYVNMYVHVYVCVCIYIYICIERERDTYHLFICLCIYIYIYIERERDILSYTYMYIYIYIPQERARWTRGSRPNL